MCNQGTGTRASFTWMRAGSYAFFVKAGVVTEGYCSQRPGVASALLYDSGAKEVNEHRVDEVPLG